MLNSRMFPNVVPNLMLMIYDSELPFYCLNSWLRIQGTIIDGKSIAEDIKLQIAEEFRRMKKAIAHVRGLPIVLLGDRRDSQSHVGFKVKGSEEVGIKSLLSELP